jgi:hypothetical protein
VTMTDQAPPTAPEAPDPEVEPTPPETAAEEHAEALPGAEVVRYERPTAMIPGIDLPVIPGGDEMKNIAALAVTLAGAAAVPKALQGKPNDVFQVLLTARDLGVALTTAMREFHVIDGRVTLSPKVKLAMVNERGAREGWAIWPDPDNDELKATWYATRADRPGLTFHSTFTLQQAKLAKLEGKDNWKSYPQRMVSWRALGYLLDDVFPEVATGIYSPDELGGMTDAEGNYIEVSATEPLQGMKAPRGQRPGDDPDGDLAPEDDRFLILCRIRALPDESRDALRERWDANTTLKGVQVLQLNHRGVRAAIAMLNGVEGEARRHDWKMDEAHEEVRQAILALAGIEDDGADPAQGRQEPPDGSGGAGDAPEPDDAAAATGAPDAGTPEQVTEEQVAEVIAEVKAMSLPKVDDELRRMHPEGLLGGEPEDDPVRGSGQDRRQRLAFGYIAERYPEAVIG